MFNSFRAQNLYFPIFSFNHYVKIVYFKKREEQNINDCLCFFMTTKNQAFRTRLKLAVLLKTAKVHLLIGSHFLVELSQSQSNILIIIVIGDKADSVPTNNL